MSGAAVLERKFDPKWFSVLKDSLCLEKHVRRSGLPACLLANRTYVA